MFTPIRKVFYLYTIHKFSRSLNVTTIIDPTLSPTTEIKDILDTQRAEIIRLDEGMVEKSSGHAHGASHELPRFPERRRYEWVGSNADDDDDGEPRGGRDLEGADGGRMGGETGLAGVFWGVINWWFGSSNTSIPPREGAENHVASPRFYDNGRMESERLQGQRLRNDSMGISGDSSSFTYGRVYTPSDMDNPEPLLPVSYPSPQPIRFPTALAYNEAPPSPYMAYDLGTGRGGGVGNRNGPTMSSSADYYRGTLGHEDGAGEREDDGSEYRSLFDGLRSRSSSLGGSGGGGGGGRWLGGRRERTESEEGMIQRNIHTPDDRDHHPRSGSSTPKWFGGWGKANHYDTDRPESLSPARDDVDAITPLPKDTSRNSMSSETSSSSRDVARQMNQAPHQSSLSPTAPADADTEERDEQHSRAPSGSIVFIRMSDGKLVRKLSTINSVGSREGAGGSGANGGSGSGSADRSWISESVVEDVGEFEMEDGQETTHEEGYRGGRVLPGGWSSES